MDGTLAYKTYCADNLCRRQCVSQTHVVWVIIGSLLYCWLLMPRSRSKKGFSGVLRIGASLIYTEML